MAKTKNGALALVLAVALTAPQSPVRAQEQATDPQLAAGIQAVRAGEFDAALIALDGVVKRLSGQKGKAQELARAYTYLAIAYVGLAQRETAQAKFIEAWKADNGWTLSPREFPPSIIELFDQAVEAVGGRAHTPARAQASPPVAAPQTQKKGGGHKGLVFLGVVGVAGAGAAVAAGGGSKEAAGPGSTPTVPTQPETPPLDPIVWGPSGTVLMGLPTRFSVHTSNCSVVQWDFGDGTVGAGSSVTYAYTREGAFNVVARCMSRTGEVSASVRVRSVTGTWDGVTADGERFVARLTHSGANITGDADGIPLIGNVESGCGTGRCVRLSPQCSLPGLTATGPVDEEATIITGRGVLPCRERDIEHTLTRRQ